MVTVDLPAKVGAFQELESTPERAMTLATDLRAVTTNVRDVQGWAERTSGGAWTGDAESSQQHARTRFSVRAAVAEAALQDAAVATDRFEDRLRLLQHQRLVLERERYDVNHDIDALDAEVRGAAAGADLASVEQRAARLRARADGLRAAVEEWVQRYADAESDLVAALTGVDTVAEAGEVAADPDRPDAHALLLGLNRRARDPGSVAAWWRTLSRAQQQALVNEYPTIVGNTDGVPAADRDEANRASLLGRLDLLGERRDDGQLTSAEREELAKAEVLREAVERHQHAPDVTTGDQLLHVIGYQPGSHSGDGGVILSLGDPGSADHVAAYVPGTTSEGGALSGLDRIETLYEDMVDEGAGSVSTILWLDYDAPSADSLVDLGELGDLGSVLSPVEAREAGGDLSDFLDGLRASDRGDPAHTTLIGHSYGATTTAHAAGAGAVMDDLVLLGSPGAPAATADALTDARVHVGSADHDPVTLLGFGERGGVGALGYDPAQESFGAQRFDVDDGSFRAEDLLANHSSYFDGPSLENLAAITTGGEPSEDAARTRGGEGHYRTLEELLAGSSAASGSEWLWERGLDAAEGAGEVGEWLWDRSRIGRMLG